LPGIYAHYSFGMGALNASGIDAADVLARGREPFILGCQGPDFCYYHMMRPGADTARWLDVAHSLHGKKIGELMRAALEKAAANAVARAYFLGFLTHYALDAHCHPYVFHHCHDKRFHMPFESAIDVALMRRDGVDPAGLPYHTILGNPDGAQARGVAAFLHALLRDVYDADVPEKELAQAVGEIRRAFRLTLSRHGVKKRLLELIAGRMGLKNYLHALFYAPEHTIKDDYLNLKRLPWTLPWDGTKVQDSSYPMLEAQALTFAGECLRAAAAYWDGEMPPDAAAERIGELSMLTGQDWRLDLDTAQFVSDRFYPGKENSEWGKGDFVPWRQF
jgi:hypothetical protein